MDKVTQGNAAAAEESAAAAEELSSQSEQMRTVVEDLQSVVGGERATQSSATSVRANTAPRQASQRRPSEMAPPRQTAAKPVRPRQTESNEAQFPLETPSGSGNDFSDFNAAA